MTIGCDGIKLIHVFIKPFIVRDKAMEEREGNRLQSGGYKLTPLTAMV